MVKVRQTLDRRRIALIATTTALVGFGAAAFLLVRHAMAEREAMRVAALRASGLARCEYDPSDLKAILRKRLPAPPTASIIVMPAFSNPVAVSLVDRDLYYFVLGERVYKPSGKSEFRLTVPVRAVSKTRLSAEVARRLPDVLEDDIVHAQPKVPTVLDGAAYYFSNSGTCAVTWSPDPGTRARKFVDLFNALELLATTKSGNRRFQERKVLAALDSLTIHDDI